MSAESKEYLGDGVYVEYDGHHLVLSTHDGISTTNTVCLDGCVLKAFDRYRTTLASFAKAPAADE